MSDTRQNWWFDGGGRNLLGGNPPILDDDTIYDLLITIARAREEFPAARAALNDAERARIDLLTAENPQCLLGNLTDPVDISDALMTSALRAGNRHPNRR